MAFQDSVRLGTLGENIILEVLGKYGNVEDVRKEKEYRAMDVDFVVYPHKAIHVEVKTDTHEPNNIFWEVIKNDNKGNTGKLEGCQADIVLYYFINHNACYKFSPVDVREWIQQKGIDTFRCVKVPDGTHNSIGALLPIKDMINDGVIHEVTRINKVMQSGG